jgi:hypothetical protein
MCPAGLNHNDFGDCPAQKYWLAEATSILGWDSVFLPDGMPLPRWHHSPDAPPEHFCADCDDQAVTIAVLRAALDGLDVLVVAIENNGIPHADHSEACHEADAKIIRAALATSKEIKDDTVQL